MCDENSFKPRSRAKSKKPPGERTGDYYVRKRYEPKPCSVCQTVFTPKTKRSETCSDTCREIKKGRKRGRGVTSALVKPGTVLSDPPRSEKYGDVFDYRDYPMDPCTPRVDIGEPRPLYSAKCPYIGTRTKEGRTCTHPCRSKALHLIDQPCVILRARNLCPWGKP